MNVIKRDGRIVEYDKNRISNAIEKAMARTKSGVNHNIALDISNNFFQLSNFLCKRFHKRDSIYCIA